MSPEWVRVDGARNIGEATLLKSALEAHDIEVGFRGEHLPSIAGELPPNEAQVEIWVRVENEARAREILARLRAPAPELPPRACVKCGEENPGNFELCWKCEWPLPKREDAQEPPPAGSPADVKPAPAPALNNTMFWVGAALLVLVAVIYFAEHALGR